MYSQRRCVVAARMVGRTLQPYKSHGAMRGNRTFYFSSPSMVDQRDHFQLLSDDGKKDSEDQLQDSQVAEMAKWWESPRYRGISRPYTPQDVVNMRGSLPQSYPSSMMARKLFDLLEKRSAQGKPVHTSMQTLLMP